MAGRRQLPDIMGEALSWLQNETPIIKSQGLLATRAQPAEPAASPPVKLVARHPPAPEHDEGIAAGLKELKLAGMSAAYEQLSAGGGAPLLDARGLLRELIRAERVERQRRGFELRLGRARLARPRARLGDCHGGQGPDLPPGLLEELAEGAWLEQGRDLVMQGDAGQGKTHLACALAHRACELGHAVLYRSLGSCMRELAQARKDAKRWARVRRAYGRAGLLVLDDWGRERLPSWQSLDLFELLEERRGRGSTLLASRLAWEAWPDILDEAPLPGAVLGELLNAAVKRLIQGALRIRLTGKANPAPAAR